MRNSLKKTKEKEKGIPKKINNYTIDQKLFETNSCSFYSANNTYISEKVLIRIISRKYLYLNTEEITHINNEIFLLKLINHKNILRLYEIIESKDYIFIIYEYFPGDSLPNFVKNQKLSENQILSILHKIIIAMIYLHNTMHISHLTINLESFLIDKDLNIKIINFKYGCIYSKDIYNFKDNKDMTLFTCPEIHAKKNYNPELADVYSCGIIVYYLYVGELPFHSNQKIINEETIMKGEYSLPENTSAKMLKIITTLLEYDSEKRKKFRDLLNEDWFKDIPNKNEEKKELKGFNVLHEKYPVDENVMKVCNAYKLNKGDIFKYLKSNTFNSITSLYKQIEKKMNNKGIKTLGDLYSDKFIGYLNNNLNHYDNEECKSNNDKVQKELHNNEVVIKEKKKKIESNNPGVYEELKKIKEKCDKTDFTSIKKAKKEEFAKMSKRRRSQLYSQQIMNSLNSKKKEENSIKKVYSNEPKAINISKFNCNVQTTNNKKKETNNEPTTINISKFNCNVPTTNDIKKVNNNEPTTNNIKKVNNNDPSTFMLAKEIIMGYSMKA